MKILAIDTSTKFMSVALSDRGKIVFNYRKDVGVKHSVLLLSVLDRLLKKSGIRKEDISLFAVGLGPGSFTGLRISTSTVKALAFALKKKVCGISSLDVIARNVREPGNISVILDAKRGNVYTSFYTQDTSGISSFRESYKLKNCILRRTSPYLLINFRDWLKRVRKKTFVLGDGLNVYRDELIKNKPDCPACRQADVQAGNIVCLSEKSWYPDAKYLTALSYEKFRNQGADSIGSILPLYCYPKECQIKSASKRLRISKCQIL